MYFAIGVLLLLLALSLAALAPLAGKIVDKAPKRATHAK
jgi:hypothetical protein